MAGKVSYGLYLWHYLFLNIDIPVWAALPLTVAVAAASWYLLEKPLLRCRARFDKRKLKREREPVSPTREAQSRPAVSTNRLSPRSLVESQSQPTSSQAERPTAATAPPDGGWCRAKGCR